MTRWAQPLLQFCAGAVSVAAFAPLGWFPLGILSLACLFHGWLRTESARQAALLGFAWGLGCFLAGISWVYVSMHVVGGMPAPVAALMTLLFCAYLALFPAFAGWFALRLRTGPLLSVLSLAAAWVLGEWLRGMVATGFPWLAIGYAHSPPSPLAGYAPLLGVYGVSLAAAVLAAAIAQLGFIRRPLLGLLALCLALPLGGAVLRTVHWTQTQGEPFSVSLLQGNVAQSLKWDPERLGLSLETYATLAKAHPAQLIVLPETAIPLLFSEVPKDYLQQLAGKSSHVLIGAAVTVRDEKRPDGYANGAVLLSPELTASAYFKRHLVPFGEFVPPAFRWFLDLMHIPMSNFTAGPETQPPLQFGGQKVMPNICYEDLFGEELIRDVPQSSLLINLSNTAWFGDSLAQPQHLQIAQMRALETGRMMLRSTNTGMTAAISTDGTVMAALPPFTRDALTVQAQGYVGLTPYVMVGNLGVGLLLFVIIWLSAREVRRLRQQ